MTNLREIEERIVANRRVEGDEIRMLQDLLYADGKIDRREADWLVELHKRVQIPSPGFEKFFYKAIKDHILQDGHIGAGEAAWLRQMIFHDAELEDEERTLLRELKGEAKSLSPEFEALFAECMKVAPEQRTSG